MKKFTAILGTMLLVALLSFSLQPSALSPSAAQAATSNPSPSSGGYETVAIPLMGTYTSTRTNLVKFTAPVGYRVVNATAYARGSGGTSPTLKVRATSAGFTIMSTSVTAGTVAQGKLATTVVNRRTVPPSLADEQDVGIDLVIGGTSPVWRDISLMLFLKRL